MASAQQRAFQTDEEIRRARAFAEIQAEEQARQAQFSQQAMEQQAAEQRARDAAMAQYAQQQQLTQGNIQSGLLGQQQRFAGEQQAYGAQQQGIQQYNAAIYQGQLAQQQHGNQMQRDVQQTDLAAQLSQVQLTQREEARRRQLREGIAALDSNPNLSPEERAMMATQMQTGLDPLEGRARQAGILHTTIQTQGLHQQNGMQAQLFNDRQRILAMRPEDRFRSVMISDGQGNQIPVTFQMSQDGNWEQVDVSRFQRAEQVAQANIFGQVAGGVATLGANQRAEVRAPLENTVLGLSATEARQRIEQLTLTNPIDVQLMSERLREARQRFEHAGQRVPAEIAQIEALTADALSRANERNTLLPANQGYLGAQTAVANANAGRINTLTEPERRHVMAQADHQELTNQFSRATEPIRVAAAAMGLGVQAAQTFEHNMRAEILQAQLEDGVSPDAAATMLRHITDTVSREAADPASQIRMRARAEAPNDQGRQAQIVNDWRTTQTQAMFRTTRQLMQQQRVAGGGGQMPNIQGLVNNAFDILNQQRRPQEQQPGFVGPPNPGGQQNVPAVPNIFNPAPVGPPRPGPGDRPAPVAPAQPAQPAEPGNEIQLLPEERGRNSTVAPARINQLLNITSGHTMEILRAPGGPSSGTARDQVSELHQILQRASAANRNLTVGEVQDYNRIQGNLAVSDPQIGRLFSLSAQPQQEAYSAPVGRLRAIQADLSSIYNAEPAVVRGLGPVTRIVGRLHDIIAAATGDGDGRPMTAAETSEYLRQWRLLNQRDPTLAARLVLHR